MSNNGKFDYPTTCQISEFSKLILTLANIIERAVGASTLLWLVIPFLMVAGLVGIPWAAFVVLYGKRSHYSGVRPYFFTIFTCDFLILVLIGIGQLFEEIGIFISFLKFNGLENLGNIPCKASRFLTY